ncbi:hypothetical protein P7K49_032878 [Saguinus oedipus]|uniref:Uncharacterized protein n=1 Tax=Saguinus oedipus TaxID=9490 RepID=A0ABQ9TQB8_SAGOE|nr:hypothetical protein P7K49_032878 [Saguinus oedipus]
MAQVALPGRPGLRRLSDGKVQGSEALVTLSLRLCDTPWGAPCGPVGLAPPRAKKREGELTVAQGRVKDLESLFHRSEAELAAALSDKRGLESDVAELRAQLAKAEDGHAVAKKQLEKETLMRVDLENRCQSLQEELDFRKSVFEEVSRGPASSLARREQNPPSRLDPHLEPHKGSEGLSPCPSGSAVMSQCRVECWGWQGPYSLPRESCWRRDVGAARESRPATARPRQRGAPHRSRRGGRRGRCEGPCGGPCERACEETQQGYAGVQEHTPGGTHEGTCEETHKGVGPWEVTAEGPSEGAAVGSLA